MLFFLLLACGRDSVIPEGSIYFDVTVTAEDVDGDTFIDTCHPDATELEAYSETFRYAVFFDANRAEVYVVTDTDVGQDAQLFAVGSLNGCDMEYATVIVGEETESDGEVKWKLSGAAAFDVGTNQCVDEEGADWLGTEIFEIESSTDDTLEVGCTYELRTTGVYVDIGAE